MPATLSSVNSSVPPAAPIILIPERLPQHQVDLEAAFATIIEEVRAKTAKTKI